MMYTDVIGEKINDISSVLLEKYKIKLKAIKDLNYGIKYQVYYEQKECGVIIVYYKAKKKQFTVTKERSKDELNNLFLKIKNDIECNEDELKKSAECKEGDWEKLKEDIKIKNKKSELEYYYQVLKPYEGLNVSFECFQQKISEYIEMLGDDISLDSSASFKELECIYKNNISGNTK